MNIRSRSTIHETAQNALGQAKNARQIILVYTAVCCGLSLVVTLLTVFFSDRIAGTGGLGSIGLRSVLSTGQSVLPLIQTIVTTCLGLGYHIAILTITRGYEAGPRVLLQGFRHWGPLVRSILLQAFVYLAIGFFAANLSSLLFLMSPLSADFLEIMEPVMANMTVMDMGLVLDDATLMAATETMMPMVWIMLAVFLLLFIPIYYRFRMITFCLAENPRKGALAAMAKSCHLLRRNCFALFRLDLSLWWYYLAQFFLMLLCYGDVILPMLGVVFPWSSTVSFYVFYLLSLALQAALYYFAMNRVNAVYAVAYDALQDQLTSADHPVQA